MSSPTNRRWWRRNWWGMAAVGPLAVAALVVGPNDSFQTLREEAAADQVVHPGADGWASYGPVRLRLAEFAPAELFDDGEPFDRPGLVAWQVTLEIDSPVDPEALLGCGLDLEDAAGRLYPEGPTVLGSAEDANGDGVYASSCSLPYDAEEGQNPFDAAGYFMLPESIEPVALRVSHYTQDPAYVRFEVG